MRPFYDCSMLMTECCVLSMSLLLEGQQHSIFEITHEILILNPWVKVLHVGSLCTRALPSGPPAYVTRMAAGGG